MKLLVAITLMLSISTSVARDVKVEFAQYTDKERQWLRDQKIPGKTSRCCDESDGTKAQEDIRGDKFWISFEACVEDVGCVTVPWMEVPAAAIIEGPNEFGRPVVWWYRDDNGAIRVKCYAGGAKG